VPNSVEAEAWRAVNARGFELLVAAKQTLGMNGVELAKLMGVAPKTVWRWLAKKGNPGAHLLGKLAPHVYPRDPELARRMHEYAKEKLLGWGKAPPPALPEPADATAPATAAPRADARAHVEATVYAACAAGDAAPRTVVPMLLAAVQRARALGLTLEDIERELAPPASRDGT
jgi:transcriptional regulator with XRE-family HTH domain